MLALIAELRATIASVAETFNLLHDEQDSRQRIGGLLSTTWQSLGHDVPVVPIDN